VRPNLAAAVHRRCRARPVASRGPRYRYDVDIWRTLLPHPRPSASTLLCVRIFLLRDEKLRAKGREGVLVTRSAAAGASPGPHRDIQAHCSDRPLWRRPTPLAHAILSYYKAAILRRPRLSHTCRHRRGVFVYPRRAARRGSGRENSSALPILSDWLPLACTRFHSNRRCSRPEAENRRPYSAIGINATAFEFRARKYPGRALRSLSSRAARLSAPIAARLYRRSVRACVTERSQSVITAPGERIARDL